MTRFLTFQILLSSQPLAFLEDKSYLESDTEYPKHSHSITTKSSDIHIQNYCFPYSLCQHQLADSGSFPRTSDRILDFLNCESILGHCSSAESAGSEGKDQQPGEGCPRRNVGRVQSRRLLGVRLEEPRTREVRVRRHSCNWRPGEPNAL